jgi:hypothetical protein
MSAVRRELATDYSREIPHSVRDDHRNIGLGKLLLGCCIGPGLRSAKRLHEYRLADGEEPSKNQVVPDGVNLAALDTGNGAGVGQVLHCLDLSSRL